MSLIRRQRCGNCVHGSEEQTMHNGLCDHVKKVSEVECRKHAPSISSGVGNGWSNQLYPFVNCNSWCGEWATLPNMVIWEEEEVDNG